VELRISGSARAANKWREQFKDMPSWQYCEEYYKAGVGTHHRRIPEAAYGEFSTGVDGS